MDLETIVAISTAITAAATVAVAWYSFENRRIRKQNIMPIIVFYVRRIQKDGLDWTYTIRNIGNGPAADIEVKAITFVDGKTEFRLEEDFMSPGLEQTLNFRTLNKKTSKVMINYDEYRKEAYKIAFFEQEFEIEIEYSDVENTQYLTKLRHRSDHSIELLSFSKKKNK